MNESMHHNNAPVNMWWKIWCLAQGQLMEGLGIKPSIDQVECFLSGQNKKHHSGTFDVLKKTQFDD